MLQEDEIDLKELFLTIWKKKSFIAIFTTIITLLAIFYALSKTPIYEAKAIIEIGSYKENNNIKLLDDTNKLSQTLNVLYIDITKNEKDRDSWIESIEVLKKQKSFLQIQSYGISNELATSEVEKTFSFIQTEHLKIINEIVEKKNIELKNVERKIVLLKENNLVSIEEDISFLKNSTLKNVEEDIKYTKNVQLPSIEQKIEVLVQKENDLKKQINLISKNILQTKSQNPALSALDVMEKRNLESALSSLELKLIDMKDSKLNIESKTLPRLLRIKDDLLNKQLPRLLRDKVKLINVSLVQLYEEKTLIEQSMLPHNYKNTSIVGNIMTNDYSVKPKKKLIVVVAFVTGFILSIFIVFFMEFIAGFKKEEDELSSEKKD